MNQELDVRVVEAMGYVVGDLEWGDTTARVRPPGEGDGYLLYASDTDTLTRRGELVHLGWDCTMVGDPPTFCMRLPRYSSYITEARRIEDWIERRHPELRDDYATALYGATCHVWQGGVCKGWALAYATPEQRCRAFLAVMGK